MIRRFIFCLLTVTSQATPVYAGSTFLQSSLIINRTSTIWETNPQFIISTWIIYAIFIGICLISTIGLYYYRQKNTALLETQRSLHTAEEMLEVQELSYKSIRTVLDSFPVPVRITDIISRQIIYMNQQCMNLFGIATLDEACGLLIYDLLPDNQENGEDLRAQADKVLDADETIDIEMPSKALDGRLIDTYIVSCKIIFNNRPASVGIIKDLAEEKAFKQMLLSTAEKEKEANQLKSRFLVNMSHEIRTPMNAIIGLTDVELYKREAGKALDVFNKINISARSLLQMMNDILDLSKIEADKMELTNDEFTLGEILSSAMMVAAPRLEGKNVEMLLNASLDLPCFLVGDKTRLWQILKNFLDNSAKFTENGRIVLTVFAEESEINTETIEITFIIEDTGIGISGDMLNDIFLPYQQVYNEAQKLYTGTGLGMPISKQLCHMMGGRLTINSDMGKGTSIHMTIPFEHAGRKGTIRQAISEPLMAGKRILVVDNDEVARSIIVNLLACNDVVCVTTESGEEALEAVAEYGANGHNFDLMLIDHTMDGLSGMETAARIHCDYAEVPAMLMVTSYERHLLQSDLDNAGIGEILEKPFIPSQLMHKISSLLGFPEVEVKTEGFMQFFDVRVLVCEDNYLNQEVAIGMFGQFGIKPAVVSNGQEALNKFFNEEYDLIFIDLYMPVMDGFETARLIRSDPRYNKIPIISLTADAMPEIINQCAAIGFNDHIAKPVEFDKLERIFMTWLPEQKRLARAVPWAANGDVYTRFSGDKQVYDNAMRLFIESIPGDWPDYTESKILVHDIKGMSGNLSLSEVYTAAVAFEDTLNNGTPDETLYNILVTAVDKHKALYLKTMSAPITKSVPADTGTLEELRGLLGQLTLSIDECDPVSSTKTAEALIQKTWADIDTELIKQLYILINEYSFFEAADVLESIKVSL